MNNLIKDMTAYKLNEYHTLTVTTIGGGYIVKLFERMGGRNVQIGDSEKYETLEDVDFEYDIKNAKLIQYKTLTRQ